MTEIREGGVYARRDIRRFRRVDAAYVSGGVEFVAGRYRSPADPPGEWPGVFVSPRALFVDMTLAEVPAAAAG